MSHFKHNDLTDYVLGLYRRWGDDRRVQLEDKWNKNRAAFMRDVEQFDDLAGVWRQYQKGEAPVPATTEEFMEDKGDLVKNQVSWHSKTFLSVIKQKVVSGANLVNDQVFKGNKVPFQFDIYTSIYKTNEEWEIINDKRNEISKELIRMVNRTGVAKEMRLTVFGCALYGEGYFKKKIEIVETKSNRLNAFDQIETILEEEEMLSGDNVSVWNIFRDLQFSNIDDGDGLIQREFVSTADMRAKLEDEGEEFYWIEDSLEEAILSVESGSTDNIAGSTPLDAQNTESVSPRIRNLENYSAQHEYLESWVRVPTFMVDKLETLIETGEYDDSDNDEEINGYYSYILLGLFNGFAVRYTRTEKGGHPYYRSIWEEDPDGGAGIGVADNVEGDQVVLNGMIRNYEDNKKLSANILLACNRDILGGDFKDWYPGKEIELEGVKDVREAIQQLVIVDTGDSLMSGIEMFMQFADMSSNIPRSQQGMQTENPATAFEIQQTLERSGKYIGTVITEFDNRLLEPYLNDAYEWLSLKPEFEDLGGAFRVTALGFSSYEARALRQQGLMAIFAMISQNPEWQKLVNGDYFLREIARGQGIPPEEFVKSKEKLQEEALAESNSMEAQLANQQMALAIEKLSFEVAKIKSERELNESKADKLDAETDQIDKQTASESGGGEDTDGDIFEKANEAVAS